MKLNGNSQLVLRSYIALYVVVTLSITSRFAARWKTGAAIKWDDGWITVAYVLYTICSALGVKLGENPCRPPHTTIMLTVRASLAWLIADGHDRNILRRHDLDLQGIVVILPATLDFTFSARDQRD